MATYGHIGFRWDILYVKMFIYSLQDAGLWQKTVKFVFLEDNIWYAFVGILVMTAK